ncbi:UNVERIFIED_CONTAM: hypothetical protein NCL1_37349 [Trichonephila clavipes]
MTKNLIKRNKITLNVEEIIYKGTDHDLKLKCAPDSSSFVLWKDAMKMVARLPDGIPPDFRKQVYIFLKTSVILNTIIVSNIS